MNSSMPWTLHVARSAEKELEGIPQRDRGRILMALRGICCTFPAFVLVHA
jgi:hypothetical protein